MSGWRVIVAAGIASGKAKKPKMSDEALLFDTDALIESTTAKGVCDVPHGALTARVLVPLI